MSLVSIRSTYGVLTENHYLGPTKTALFAWGDDHGVMVFSNPRSRNLPAGWLELVRWCIVGGKNSGSRQWSSFAEFARSSLETTTIVSYSDPSKGHTGALYRACNWLWAPTWHRLRPPPSGNGQWTVGKTQAVKDRWIFPLKPDAARATSLFVNDETLMRAKPWASYREPSWRNGRFDPASGGGDYKRWIGEAL